jgi:hypothetical protein
MFLHSVFMNEYDIVLKNVLRQTAGSVLRELTGFTVTRWHNVELPAVQNEGPTCSENLRTVLCCTLNFKARIRRV